MYGIAVISIVLGFIALLKQKNYIDTQTKSVTDIEIPFLGRLKTNYPSLVFLFLGIFVSVYTFHRSQTNKQVWEVSGTFSDPQRRITDWASGELNIKPSSIITKTVDENGNFSFQIVIDADLNIEDVVETITYSNSKGSAYIVPNEEETKYKDGDTTSLIKKLTRSARMYKAACLNYYQ